MFHHQKEHLRSENYSPVEIKKTQIFLFFFFFSYQRFGHKLLRVGDKKKGG